MEIIRKVDEMIKVMKAIKQDNKTVGFVPTMGYLHNGHKSLIDRARKENDIVAVSVFVNPTQFGPNEDFEKYPRNEEGDAKLCLDAGCDFLFIPDKNDMYGEDYFTYVEVLNLTEGLCGASRPGHFKGVTTVVTKLFNIIKPNRAYFGQKDAQQLAVLKRMVRDLNMDIEIIGCPIVREEDGLALSSRNTYLNPDERQQALVLNLSLKEAAKLIENGETDALLIRREIGKIINKAPSADIDYIEIVDNNTLKPVKKIEGEILLAIAVKIGKTRLIDNMVVIK